MSSERKKSLVLALPFAGGDKRSYDALVHKTGSDFDWVVPESPGHGDRAGEPLLGDLVKTAQDVKKQWLETDQSGPFALFGHSMGALVGYELLLSLAEENRPLPRFAYLTACRPPNAKGRTAYADMDSQVFWENIASHIGLPRAVVDDARWRAATEPVLREDCRAMENYPGKSTSFKVPVPLYFRYGDQEDITREEAGEWKNYSSVHTDVRAMPGDHFFIYRHGGKIVDEIARLMEKFATA